MTMPGRQRGVFLIEALMGILIFSLGILTLVAMQTAAVSAQSDAQYRIEAANLADQIVSEIWVNVNRTADPATTRDSLEAFRHLEGGGNCNFSGAASGAKQVEDWVAAVTAAGTGLPGATEAMQQILVNTVPGSFNQVSVTVCWKAPMDAADAPAHRHTVVTFIN